MLSIFWCAYWLFVYLCEIFVQIFSPSFYWVFFSLFYLLGVLFFIKLKSSCYFLVSSYVGGRYELLYDTWTTRNAKPNLCPQCPEIIKAHMCPLLSTSSHARKDEGDTTGVGGWGRWGRSARMYYEGAACGSFIFYLWSPGCLIFSDAEVDQWIWQRKTWSFSYEAHLWPFIKWFYPLLYTTVYSTQDKTEILRRIFPHQSIQWRALENSLETINRHPIDASETIILASVAPKVWCGNLGNHIRFEIPIW